MSDSKKPLPHLSHIHLDALGGISGDMFIAALLDAFPELWPELSALLHTVLSGLHSKFSLSPSLSNGISGKHFELHAESAETTHHHHEPHGAHAHHHSRPFAEIERQIREAPVDAAISARALAIYHFIGEAEATVHGASLESVHLHELGSADSVADVFGAAFLIERLRPKSWSIGELPLGAGTIRSDHGPLPVPAPATTLLLQGYTFRSDGIPGERVTPTGAAILRAISCSQRSISGPQTLARTGVGIGSKQFPGISNSLRVLAFTDRTAPALPADVVELLEFEIDDQTGEDLAIALEHLRAASGVLDVLQSPAFGKKGRLCTRIQILVRPEAGDDIVQRCFQETATLGIRRQTITRAIAPREHIVREIDGRALRVKASSGPGGETRLKLEADETASLTSKRERDALRRKAEEPGDAE